MLSLLLTLSLQLMRSLRLMLSPQPMRSPQFERSPQLMPSLQLVRSRPHVPRLHPALRRAPRALLVRRRKVLEVKNSVGK